MVLLPKLFKKIMINSPDDCANCSCFQYSNDLEVIHWMQTHFESRNTTNKGIKSPFIYLEVNSFDVIVAKNYSLNNSNRCLKQIQAICLSRHITMTRGCNPHK